MKSVVVFSVVLIALFYFNSCKYNPIEPYDSTPKVFIINPVNNSSVSDSVTVSILVNNIDVKRVELFIDHYIINDAVFQKPPYEFFWDCRWYPEASQHILQAKAYNQSGKVIESDFTIINIYRFMPSSLMANLTSDTTVSLNWIDNCKFETSFQLEQAIDDTNFVKIADLDSNTTAYTLNGHFLPEKQYLFRVRAVADNQFSGYSNISKALIELFTPISLTSFSTSDTSVVLRWEDNNTFEKGYSILTFSNGVYSVISTLPPGSTSFTHIKQFYLYQQYQYAIHAVRDNYSSPIGSFPPVIISFPSPSNLTFEHVSQTSVKLKWNDNSSFEKGFIIYRADDQNVFSEIARVGKNNTEFINTNLDTAKSYLYNVRAYTDANLTETSNTIKVFFAKTISLNKQIQVPYGISEAAVSDDFSTVAIGGYISNRVCIRVFNLANGVLLRTFLGDSTDQIFERLAVSPDNKYVAGMGNYYSLTIWDINSGLLVRRMNIGTEPNFIQYSSDGKYLIMERNDKLRIYNTNDWSYVEQISFNDYATIMAIDNDQKSIAIGFDNGNTRIWDYATGIFKSEIPNSFRSTALHFGLDDSKLFIATYGDFKVWNFNLNSFSFTINNFGYSRYVDITSDGNTVVNAGFNGVSVWNVERQKHLDTFLPEYGFKEIKISPDSKTLFAREFHTNYFLFDFVEKWVQDIN